ncbi:hypothetical protein JOD20_003562, partial [Herpetosiphon giganteus]|nr:hypothetical protein [Herpetosiphon giganteus]
PDPPATSRGTVLSGTMVTRVNYLPLKASPLSHENAGEGEHQFSPCIVQEARHEKPLSHRIEEWLG